MERTVFTGYKLIDEEFGGLRPGEITLIGGRPVMGKTSLALSIAYHAAQNGKNVVYLSSDRGMTELEICLVGMITKIPVCKLRAWELSDEEWGIFKDAICEIRSLPLQLLFADSMFAINYFCKKNDMTENADLIIVDCLQSLVWDYCKPNKHNYAPTEYLKMIRRIAKKRNVPVVVLTQLSKKLEKRKDKHPKKKDIRRMGIPDSYYNQAFCVYRDSYYDADVWHATIDRGYDNASLIGIWPEKKVRRVYPLAWNVLNIAFEELIDEKEGG